MTAKLTKLRFLLLYGLAIGVLLCLMAWSKYRFMIIDHAVEAYVLLVAAVFVGVGIWVGLRWSAPSKPEVTNVPGPPASPATAHQRDTHVLEQLGISNRELDVLIQLAKGLSNEEIADQLFVSTNTVKTHLGNLYTKLDVKRRTQAIDKARSLGLIS
ncbi:response regulator transcription factor [Fibrella aquatica]|uniref:response regulator transcription factor n=1 Tax=Fibrella aquatica TaxID=3242487 RepID=UPI0035223C2E